MAKKKAKEGPEIPSERNIDRLLKRLNRKFSRNKKKYTIIISVVFIIFIIVMLTLFNSRFFWQAVGLMLEENELRKEYLLESCSTGPGHFCEIRMYDERAVFILDLGKKTLTGIKFPACGSYEIKENNTAFLYDCNFSSLSNSIDILITYRNPLSSLNHREKAKVVNFFEITTLKYFAGRTLNKVKIGTTGLVTRIDSIRYKNSSLNNKTYK
ncbi:hypothetical protein GF323_01035 [Candidatus Woesearchaeota archaeon]|nr:hypothetical protein [Candidatus Woesearchaeota archaeon]